MVDRSLYTPQEDELKGFRPEESGLLSLALIIHNVRVHFKMKIVI